MQTTPTGFITLTNAATLQATEVDLRVENIVGYFTNDGLPTKPTIVILDSGAQVLVKESVEEIRRILITVQPA